MTLKDLKGLIDWRYMREAKRRKEEYVELGRGEFKVMYETVVDELYRKLSIEDLSVTISITPVTVFTEYALPSSYGGYRSHEFLITSGGQSARGLEIVSMDTIPTLGNLISGTPNKMAIYQKSDGQYYVYLYPLSSFSGSLKIRFKRIQEISEGASAIGGIPIDLSDIDFTVPRTYQALVMDGIMAQIYPDMLPWYEQRLEQAIYERPTPNKGEVAYNFGGLNDDEVDNGFSKNFNGDL